MITWTVSLFEIVIQSLSSNRFKFDLYKKILALIVCIAFCKCYDPKVFGILFLWFIQFLVQISSEYAILTAFWFHASNTILSWNLFHHRAFLFSITTCTWWHGFSQMYSRRHDWCKQSPLKWWFDSEFLLEKKSTNETFNTSASDERFQHHDRVHFFL